MQKNILFICGSINQTTMMHKISQHLRQFNCYFTPYYNDGFLKTLAKAKLLDFSILGGQFRQNTELYLKKNNLEIDYAGSGNNYNLVITCSDLIIPRNIRQNKLILVQEGMTDPENFMYYLVKWFKLPRYLASTSTTGLSDAYDIFCVASSGYKDYFIRKGINPDKIKITGIPNFDNVQEFNKNDFPYKNYTLVATSDSRETFKVENRKRFIYESLDIAGGRQVIFKLHPNEKVNRAVSEIKKYAPGALVFSDGNINHMIANCDVLVTRFSSVVYVGLALGKEVHSYFDVAKLKEMIPIQNGGKSDLNIANECINILK